MSQLPILKLHDIVDSTTIEIARRDPKQIIEKFFKIIDKDGNKVPFIFNQAQNEYYKSMTARDDILKSRKEGFSSLILAILTVKFLFVPNVECVCISHEDNSTQRLFEKVEFFLDNLEYNGFRIEVDIKDRSRKRLKYGYNNSTFYIGTAGSKTFGRGDTIHYLHCSEIAFWENASRLMTGLMNAVPDNLDNTFIVKESTANGYGTQHQIEWENEINGLSAFKPHFFGWHKDPTNKKDPTGFVPSDEEKKLAIKYYLSVAQLTWRRWKISTMQPDPKKQMTKEDLFRQEFPIDPREAFLSSGKPIFDLTILDWYEEVHCKDPLMVGDLAGWNPPIFVADVNGRLKIWKEPIRDHQYVIAGDVAETGDYSCLTVIDRVTFEQVAEWHGHIDEFEFASVIYKLGKYYLDALVGIERNNQGVAVVKKLDELNYSNQYVRESIDDTTNKRYNELGWRTDSKTRPIMISDFNEVITNRRYLIRSKLVIDQCRTFVRNSQGRAEAQSNCHDDAVITNCIGVQMYKFLPEPIKDEDVIARDYRPNNSLSNFLPRKV